MSSTANETRTTVGTLVPDESAIARVPAVGAVRRAAAVLMTFLTALVLATATAPGAAAQGTAGDTGWVRLAHLSPNTPEVDVRLTSFTTGEEILLEDVGYGTLSDFQRVPAGTYNVSMVPAAAPADAPPVITETVNVAAGSAYSVIAVGMRENLTATVLSDDLTPPPPGQAKVRLVQAASRAPVVDVSVVNGPQLAQGAQFATATGYATVPAQQWTVRVQPTEGSVEPTTADLALEPGSTTTVLVLDDPAGGITVRSSADSASMAQMPSGGVDTGAGPARTAAGGHVPALAAVMAALVVAGVTLARVGAHGARRRLPTRR